MSPMSLSRRHRLAISPVVSLCRCRCVLHVTTIPLASSDSHCELSLLSSSSFLLVRPVRLRLYRHRLCRPRNDCDLRPSTGLCRRRPLALRPPSLVRTNCCGCLSFAIGGQGAIAPPRECGARQGSHHNHYHHPLRFFLFTLQRPVRGWGAGGGVFIPCPCDCAGRVITTWRRGVCAHTWLVLGRAGLSACRGGLVRSART